MLGLYFYPIVLSFSCRDDNLLSFPLSHSFLQILILFLSLLCHHHLDDDDNNNINLTSAAETLVIDYAIQVHCDLMKVGGEFNPRPNAFAYNKKNTIVKEFDSIIEELKDDGTIERMKEYWWHHNVPKRNCYEHRKLYNGITLQNAAGIFMVISVGVMATLVSLWIENWYYDLRTKSDMMMKAKSDRMLLMPPVDAARKGLRGSRCLIQ